MRRTVAETMAVEIQEHLDEMRECEDSFYTKGDPRPIKHPVDGVSGVSATEDGGFRLVVSVDGEDYVIQVSKGGVER